MSIERRQRISICLALTKYQAFRVQSILIIHGSFNLSSQHKHWISKHWTIAHRRNTGLGSCDHLVIMFLSTNQYRALFCVFLFKDTLKVHTADLLTLNSHSTALWHMFEQSFSNTCIFSTGHITPFLHLETVYSMLALCFGAIFNSEITNRKYKNANNMALSRSKKRTLVYSMRDGIRKQSIIFSYLS